MSSANRKSVSTASAITDSKPLSQVPSDLIGISGTAPGLFGVRRSRATRSFQRARTLHVRRNEDFAGNKQSTRHASLHFAHLNLWGIAHGLRRQRFGLCHFWTIPPRYSNVTCVTASALLTFARFTVATLTEREAWA